MHMKIIPPLLFKTPRPELIVARAQHAVPVFAEYTGSDVASRFLQRRPTHPPHKRLPS